jgi:hypothetical protein
LAIGVHDHDVLQVGRGDRAALPCVPIPAGEEVNHHIGQLRGLQGHLTHPML